MSEAALQTLVSTAEALRTVSVPLFVNLTDPECV
jgi:hypothetical protein